MADGSQIKGKTIALTGAFTKMKRAQASAELEKLGAIIAKSLTRKCDMLIYGERAGSKLNKAQSLGVEMHNEDWLVAVLAGDNPDAQAELSGPLSNYMERVDQLVAKLRADPRVFIRYYRAPGVSSAGIKKTAKAWGVEALAPSIENFYQQANGFMLCWFATQHPEWKDYKDNRFPTETRHPTSYEMESLPWELGGLIWVLPIEDALCKSKGYINFAYGVVDPEEERTLCGRTFKGEALERAVRVFEYGMNYYPVTFLSGEGIADPPVLPGDDYGACFEDGSETTFEDYLESLLGAYGYISARRNPGRAEPFDFEAFLPKSETLEVEETFSIEVLSSKEIDPQELRARCIAVRHSSYYKRVAKELDIGERSSRSRLEVCRDIARATVDMKALDMTLVKKMASSLLMSKRTKKAMSESLFCDVTKGAVEIEVVVTTLFNATAQKKHQADHDATQIARAYFKEGARIFSTSVLKSSGRKKRKTRISLTMSKDATPEIGATTQVSTTPSGFVEQNGALIWVI